MKNTLIVILLVSALALGILSWHQKQQSDQVQAQLVQVQKQLTAAQSQLAEKSGADEKAALAEKKSKILQDVLTDTSKFAAEKSQQAQQLQQSLAAAKTNDASPFAGMFKDPAMKEMIKNQQKAVLGPMIAKQYAALFQQLGLTPEQTTSLKDLLQQKMLAGTEAGMSMLDGSLDATKRAELAKQMKSQTEEYDAQIKQFLGEDNYQTFQSYEKTMPDRMVVSQFGDQLAGGPTALSADQQQQLIQAMSEERSGFKWTTDFNNQNPANGDFTALFTEDKMNQFTQEKAKLDELTLTRARSILTPDQVTVFQEFQASQRQMQIAGMKMAAKMFAPKSP